MKTPTERKLFAIFLIVAFIGFILLFYDMILSMVFLVPSSIAIGIMLTERHGIATEWWQFIYLKNRGRTQKKVKRKKVPFWYAIWWVALISILVLDVYMLNAIPFIGVILFFIFLINLFVMLFHDYGKD